MLKEHWLVIAKSFGSKNSSRLTLSALAVLLAGQPANCADYWWDSNGATAGFGNAAGTWGTSDFWSTSNAGTATVSPVITNTTDAVNFGTATLNYANSAVGIAASGVSVNAINYGAGQSTSIELGSAGSALNLDGGLPAITVNHPTAAQTILSPITGSAGLTKSGAGTLILSGMNSYTGVTTLAAGTLRISSLSNAGSDSGIGNFATAGATGLIISGGTLDYAGTSAATDRGFTVTGATRKTISVGSGVNLTLGASVKNESVSSTNALTFVAAGAGSSITISSLTIAAGTNPDFNISTNTPSVTIQNLNVSGSNVIAERTDAALLNIGNINGTNASGWLSNLNVTGVISGYTGNIILGGNVSLSGLSTFNVPVFVQQGGTYTYNSIKNWNDGASALGAPTTAANGTITIGNGGFIPILRYVGTGDTTNRALHLRGSGTIHIEQAGTGLLHFTGNTSADSGNTGAKTINFRGSTAGTGQFSGNIVEHNTTNRTSVSKSGTGQWTLSGANTYTGTTTVNAGTLALGANNVLPNSSALTISGGTLDVAEFTETAGTLAITGTASINLGANAAIAFADSSSIPWPGTLNITGIFTATSVRFGNAAAALTRAQLDKITVNGAGLGGYSLDANGYLIFAAAPPDTAAPTPNPMTWATVPNAIGTDSIAMTASTATDASGVEYFFDETTGNPGGTDSGWQLSSSYTDTGLSPSTTYTYTVRARDRSAGQNATSISAAASATTATPTEKTVWNVQFATQTGNQITTTENFRGAATENTVNSTWNRISSLPQTNMVLRRSTSENTGATLDISGGTIGTQNVLSGDKIFNSRIGGGSTTTMTLKGLSITSSYDLVFYSDWWWRNGDALPITQTAGTGLSSTFFLNRILGGTNGELPPLTRDTNAADVTTGSGNIGNWMRVNGLTPNINGELSFRLTDGNNTPFNGFQLIATPIAPKADILSLTLASNPPSIQNAVISATSATLTVPFGTDVRNLAPTYTLWPGASCTTPSGTARNFSTPQTYTVTSSDSLVTKNYTVTVVVAPPLPEFTLSAPANWDGRSSITVQPVISNLALLQANNGTSFTYNWNARGIAVTQTTSPSVMTLTRSQGNGTLVVSLTMMNGTLPVTRSTTINVQQPATDPWIERTSLANEKPVTGQFFARNPFTNFGTIFYRGTQSGSPTDVFLKIYRTPSGGTESLHNTLRQTLTAGVYNFTAAIEAGLFTYRVEYGTRTGSTDTVVAAVTNLLCGDAFIIEGQSNAQATDTGTNIDQLNISDPWVKTYDATLGWGPAYAKPLSPEWGSKVGFWGMKLAQDLVVQHSIPVCIINGAVGGTRIDQHLPNPTNRTQPNGPDAIYANLLNRVMAARLTNGIRGIFWHQGESDSDTFGPPIEPDHLFYEQNFLAMSTAWKQDFPNFQRYVIFQIAPNPCSINEFDREIREVQRQLPRLYSNMSIVNSIAVPGYLGCHYTKAGYENLAARVLPVVNRDFYGMAFTTPVTPPNLVRAYFTSSARNAIALQFDQAMSWNSFSSPNFFINDANNLVSSGSAAANIVTLQLSTAVPLNSTIDYVRSSWNFQESVTSLLFGANTLPSSIANPALTFANVAISAASPYQSWINSKNLSGLAGAGDADPDGDEIKNALEFVLGGEPNPANPGSMSSSLAPTSSRNPLGDLIFTFKRQRESIGVVALSFSWSTNLTFLAVDSIPIGSSNSTLAGVTVTVSSFDASTEQIVVTVPASKAVNGRLFGRLVGVLP